MSDQGMGTGTTPGALPPPGWYPDAQGDLRWWTGTQWTDQAAGPAGGASSPVVVSGPKPPMSVSEAKSQAVLAEVLGIVTGWIGPLIIYLVNGDRDPFVRHHAAEALNFHLTLLIAYLVCIPLMFLIVGFLLLPILWVASIVFGIVGAMAANRGEWYRYPISIRMVSGGVAG